MKTTRLPKLPQLIDRKIYKTGQTRGADDDVIYQNRVSRSSTVLIPYSHFNVSSKPPDGDDIFDNGFIVLISPTEYFTTKNIGDSLKKLGLELGINTLIFYETREEWNSFNPKKNGFKPATSRNKPLNGKYVARVPATTATKDGEKIVEGFSKTAQKGAGIRIFEYASLQTNKNSCLQLEALFWLCTDSIETVINYGMTEVDAIKRKEGIIQLCIKNDLLDYNRLINSRILNQNKNTICPLCLINLTSKGFFNRMEQAIGREVPDLTVTELNLFHIKELRLGEFNHKPYNLGWGHHHCNVVVKDSGIIETIVWMDGVLQRNIKMGYHNPKTS